MTKYLLAIVAVVGMSTVACGGDDCTAAADDVKAKYEECGVPVADTDSDSGDSAECTEEAGNKAKALAACITDADCAVIKDPAAAATDNPDAVKSYSDCVTAAAQ